MDAIENTELGRELDTLALHLGLKALHENPRLRLSINMSARSIGYRPWSRTLDRWLNRDELLGERLVLEITESSAMLVPELVIDFMDRLQIRGICFAMDDFGAGYTALRYFKDFFFDMIKIDGQFIRGIAQNADNQVMVAAIVSIARHFDMLTVAEFVENGEDAAMLTQLGIDCLQGYHFAAATTRPDWEQDPHVQPA
jgi:EAL domain-containing protein (putative c-di-GMP-specific phosphodiesterase class I)